MQIKLKTLHLKVASVILIFLSFIVIYHYGSGEDVIIPKISSENCVPAFLDGGGPYYKPNSPSRYSLAPEKHNGEEITISGYMFDKNCSQTIKNALIDIWQAGEDGEYADSYYRAKVLTDENGYFEFKTVIPKGYGSGTGYRPPHIHFKVFIGEKEVITSQIFFEDVRGKAGFKDQYIIRTEKIGEKWLGEHNIVLPI